ncbi:hypothetical protein TNCV_1555051 [Trichonephila clavipes]|nr:hypothetical protein TNCV_1555051 [Trichonephila clavipes]
MSKCSMNNQVRKDARQALGSHCKPSYANVGAPSGVTKNKGKSSDYCVAVDSDNFPSEDVKKIIKAKINPVESKLGVCDLKNIRGNKLLVKCFSENDRDRLLTEIQEKSPELKASVPNRRNPSIIVKNVSNEVNNEDLLKVITEQNPEVVVDDERIRQFRFRFTLKTFQHTRRVVIGTHPTSLFIINEDCGPTFCVTQGTRYIDIKFIGSDLLEDNSSWCLFENKSFSDHVMIEYEFCLSTVLRDTSSAPFVIFNTKKANWCRFRKFCLFRKTHIFDYLNSCTNSSSLNTVIEELSFVIYQACLHSMPIKKNSKHNVPWWSIEIGCVRKILNTSRRRFQRCKNPTIRESYKNNYLEYRKYYNQMLINAKSESWKKFLLTIDAQNLWKKVYTYGVKKEFMKKIELTGIKLPTGEITTSLDEIINAVLQKSFASDSEEKDNIFPKDYRHARRTAYPSFFILLFPMMKLMQWFLC